MVIRLTLVILWTKALVVLASSIIHKKTFVQNPSLADVIFTEGLLFDAVARSPLHCMWTCATTPCCRAYTYTKPSYAETGRIACRGHSAVVSAQTAKLSAPGARTFYRAPGGYGGRSNVAVGKPAVQSATHSSESTASKAVDNDTRCNYLHRSCAITPENSQNPWWQVDLGHLYDVTSVVITNRGDCCHERLYDFDVDVYTEDPITTTAAMATVCHHYCGPMAACATEELPCDSGVITGRYVRVINGPHRPLQLCEVQVFALDN